MAFARFSDGDVYVYLNVDGLFECCACCLSGLALKGWCHLVETSAEMLAHLEEHRAAGDDVPEGGLEALRADAEANDRRAARSGSGPNLGAGPGSRPRGSPRPSQIHGLPPGVHSAFAGGGPLVSRNGRFVHGGKRTRRASSPSSSRLAPHGYRFRTRGRARPSPPSMRRTVAGRSPRGACRPGGEGDRRLRRTLRGKSGSPRGKSRGRNPHGQRVATRFVAPATPLVAACHEGGGGSRRGIRRRSPGGFGGSAPPSPHRQFARRHRSTLVNGLSRRSSGRATRRRPIGAWQTRSSPSG